MLMDLESNYEIARTANFIYSRNFSRVALQFPDEHLKNATRLVSALRDKLNLLGGSDCKSSSNGVRDVRLFVMADTTYGSCCVDEVGASHVGADCVIHYGHACLSMTSALPALFVFGKASINVPSCAETLSNFALTNKKPVLVLYGLEYAYAMQHIKEASAGFTYELKPQFTDILCLVMDPSNDHRGSNGSFGLDDGFTNAIGFDVKAGSRYNIGGLTWNLPQGRMMEDYVIFWIGAENSAFSNVMLTFNGCEIVRYDVSRSSLVKDVPQQRKILNRRYYLVEKAKDANIVGILVGTLGVAGYLSMIRQLKELIAGAGKKAYTFVMGRPNPAKLANFPECDVFIYVSCAQTAMLDSKEYLAPVITPFEALLAFSRGRQWTGEYVMEFRDLITPLSVQDTNHPEEARFSFLKGGYVEGSDIRENVEEEVEGSTALAYLTEKALRVGDGCSGSLTKGPIKSGADFLAARSYRGLDMHHKSSPSPFITGRTGRASRYENETGKQ